ncbi:hypothetical protein AVEN_152821-1 [Araneus ventricosus]|uniref:H15 domain-containing protein n=1 Tax=Araneus ventricosus TaxID=182803 RepID=A0A4Y2THL3_ARAVE|nr:hypothetical protein AVEN_152821-1 [Araneus ventricosus]
MDQNFTSSAVACLSQQRPAINGNTVSQAILHVQKLKSCSVNNLKKYLSSQHGIDSQVLYATIKPIMKMAMVRNIMKNLGYTGKVSECKKRRKFSGGGKKRRKSGSKKKGKKSSGGNKLVGNEEGGSPRKGQQLRNKLKKICEQPL